MNFRSARGDTYSIFCAFVHETEITLHYFCMDEVGWMRPEVGLKQACRLYVFGGLMGFLRSKSSQ
jgi:hypothetical protein